MFNLSTKIKESMIVTVAIELNAQDSEEVIFMDAGADNVVITLPKDLIPGFCFTFIQSKASAGETCRLTPVSSKIIGYVSQQEGGNADATTADGLVSVLDGTDGKYVQLTKATGHQGDWIRLICNGSDWYVVGGVGTFTHES